MTPRKNSASIAPSLTQHAVTVENRRSARPDQVPSCSQTGILRQQFEHHGPKIYAHFTRLTQHVHAEKAMVKIVAYWLGENLSRPKRGVYPPNQQLYFRQRNCFPLVRTPNHCDLLLTLCPALFQKCGKVVRKSCPELRTCVLTTIHNAIEFFSLELNARHRTKTIKGQIARTIRGTA
jgi:hypothetical protein